MSKIILLILFSVITTYAHAKILNETHVVTRHHASRPLAEHPVVEIHPRDHHLLNATIKHIEHNTTQHLIKKEINLRKMTEMVVNVKHNLTHFFHNIHANSSLVGKHENLNKTRDPSASPSIFEITREKISNISQSFKTIDFSKDTQFMNESFLYNQPAWLIGLAIIGAVLSLYLVACFVSIGFSMVDCCCFYKRNELKRV